MRKLLCQSLIDDQTLPFFDTYSDIYCEGLRGFYALIELQVLRTRKEDATRMITISD